MGQDKRRFQRFMRDIGVEICSENEAGSHEAGLVDVCRDGMGFYSRSPLEAGKRFAFKLELPDGFCRGVAHICWVQPHHLGWRCGARILQARNGDLRRLKLFLEPGAFDTLRLFDRVLWVAAAATALFVFLSRY
ncbi:MAG: PilZ domain-containing protein [Elusimicrobiota bacterium]